MKNGTLYGAKIKKVFAKLRQTLPQSETPQLQSSERDEPLRRLAIAILGVGCSDDEASEAIDRAFTTMVDWNEMRVSSAFELNKATGNTIPQGTQRCQHLIDALQHVFDRENRLSLDQLNSMGRRDARRYLELIAGGSEYSTASVILWSLGGHAIPVNDRLFEALREEELVNPSADRAEVQAFLERHVAASDAQDFCGVMQAFAADRSGGTGQGEKKTSSRKKRTAKP